MSFWFSDNRLHALLNVHSSLGDSQRDWFLPRSASAYFYYLHCRRCRGKGRTTMFSRLPLPLTPAGTVVVVVPVVVVLLDETEGVVCA